jgi:hypothetical protein
MSIRKTVMVVASAFSCALPVIAQAATCSPKLGPAEQIACLQTQNAVLKELIASKDLYKKLEGDETTPRKLTLPVVMSIFGANDKVQAVLSYAGTGGGSITVAPGGRLPNGWQVQSIDKGAVVIAKGKASHLLLLSGGAPPQSEAARPMGLATAHAEPFGGSMSAAPPFPGFMPAQAGAR